MSDWNGGPRLLADVGGTNARFALETAPQQFTHVRVLSCAAYATLADAMRAYLADRAVAAAGLIQHAAIAIANPVEGDVVCMTNHHWRFSIAALRAELGLDTLLVMNDFSALARALPHLGEGQRVQVGGGVGQPGRTLGLVGPGTGLGVSGLVPAGDDWIPLSSEGGHASFAPADESEVALLEACWPEFGHVSAERLLSGPGIEMIHRVTCGQRLRAAEITRRALDGECERCAATVERFCGVLGGVAGNVALTLGATGGVYIGGGIVPRMGDLFHRSSFRARFEGKGRLSSWLAPIPTYLITEPYPAFLGASAMLSSRIH